MTLLILAIVAVIVLVRLITLPFRVARRARFFGGYGNGYGLGNGFGYGGGWGNRYGYGCRHHRGGGLFTILALVALDRIFTGRRF